MNGAAATTARALVLWLGVTGGAAVLASAAAEPARQLPTSPGPDFAALLVQACAGAALVAVGALWLLTTDVVVRDVLLGGRATRRARRCGAVRAAILTCCGVAVLAGTTSAASAYDAPSRPPPASVLAGLPMPDRATGEATGASRGGSAPGSATVRVRPGDSLWSIAERALGPRASGADVASYWHRLQQENRDVVGGRADLIHPGQRLRLPRPD